MVELRIALPILLLYFVYYVFSNGYLCFVMQLSCSVTLFSCAVTLSSSCATPRSPRWMCEDSEQVSQPLTQKMDDRSGGDNRESARDGVSRAPNLLTRAVELLSNDGSSAVSNRGGAHSADSSASSVLSCGSAVQPPPSSSEEWHTFSTHFWWTPTPLP